MNTTLKNTRPRALLVRAHVAVRDWLVKACFQMVDGVPFDRWPAKIVRFLSLHLSLSLAKYAGQRATAERYIGREIERIVQDEYMRMLHEYQPDFRRRSSGSL